MELPSPHQEAEPDAEPAVDQNDDLGPSKSQRKREADEVRDFARLLTTLPSRKLKKLPLPTEIEDAIKKCPPPSTRGAHKRHLQFIGKLLRKSGLAHDLMQLVENPESAAPSQQSVHETMRENLLTALPDYVDEFREKYPSADLQRVRQLVRQANSHITTQSGDEQDSKTTAINKKAAKAKSTLLMLLRENADTKAN